MKKYIDIDDHHSVNYELDKKQRLVISINCRINNLKYTRKTKLKNSVTVTCGCGRDISIGVNM